MKRAVRSGCAAFLACCLGCAPRSAPMLSARDPGQARQRHEEGLSQLQQGRYEAAESAFRAALAADPFFGPAHANLGVALLRLGRPYDAAWELQHAAQLMPRAAPPRSNLGVLFAQAGRYGEAEESLRAALRLDPDDLQIIGQLAVIHLRQGIHTDETHAWLSALAARDPDPQWRRWAQHQLTRGP